MEKRDPSSFFFNDDEVRQIEEHVNATLPKLVDMNENLATDTIKVPNQHFALLSIVSKNTNQHCDKNCIKIKGVFNTIEEANQHAQRLTQIDATFDIIVVSMYEWLLIPPDLSKINDQVYMDQELNDLISEYRQNQERTRVEFEIREDVLKKKENDR